MEDGHGNICGIEIKSSRIDFLSYDSFLHINIEQGIVENSLYCVRNYGYHFHSREIDKTFRLDSKIGNRAHINNEKGDHLYYNQKHYAILS